jgi:hypothetical protein
MFDGAQVVSSRVFTSSCCDTMAFWHVIVLGPPRWCSLRVIPIDFSSEALIVQRTITIDRDAGQGEAGMASSDRHTYCVYSIVSAARSETSV